MTWEIGKVLKCIYRYIFGDSSSSSRMGMRIRGRSNEIPICIWTSCPEAIPVLTFQLFYLLERQQQQQQYHYQFEQQGSRRPINNPLGERVRRNILFRITANIRNCIRIVLRNNNPRLLSCSPPPFGITSHSVEIDSDGGDNTNLNHQPSWLPGAKQKGRSSGRILLCVFFSIDFSSAKFRALHLLFTGPATRNERLWTAARRGRNCELQRDVRRLNYFCFPPSIHCSSFAAPPCCSSISRAKYNKGV